MQGKNALVTGSTSGIGLGIANRLAAGGCNVMLNGFGEPAQIDSIRADLAARHGVRVEYCAADLSKPEQIDELVRSSRERLGGIDILVNNAGIQHTAPVQEFPPERWDAIIAVNLSAVFHCTRLVVPEMLERDWGRIVNIASVHGLVGSVHKVAYIAAKHGVVGLTKVVALETAESGVTCNAICPGWVLTPLVQKQVEARASAEGISVEAAKLELLSEKQPSKAFVTPEQLGEVAVFLCTDAAAQVRGAAWTVDGGWCAQ
ncbi:MAG: 3-hydroxybutyrate dehydrogenase [Gammaproteobacteria bacterium]|nr:3-hydroxybutyrate dehydrogenase [Gammaproteobacteria bacterium]